MKEEARLDLLAHKERIEIGENAFRNNSGSESPIIISLMRRKGSGRWRVTRSPSPSDECELAESDKYSEGCHYGEEGEKTEERKNPIR